MKTYDHTRATAFSEDQCQEAVGKRANLPLTGEIVESRVSDAGPFVMFKADEHWGFGDQLLGLDLDALEVQDPGSG